MFFRLFNKPVNRPIVTVINLMVLFCFIISINACKTTETVKYQKEELKLNENLKIISLVLKNGTKINTESKTVIYKENYNDSLKVFLIMATDSIVGKEIRLRETSTPGVYDTVKVNYKKITKAETLESVIPLNDVSEIYIEKEETNVVGTVLTVVGISLGLAIIIAVIAGTNKKDPEPTRQQCCPFIYSFNGEKYVFDGEPLGGAICEGLTRTDYSRLEELNPSNGKFKLLIRNEADEKQYLDEIKLMIVPHGKNTLVTPNPEGEFFNYTTIISPESVKDENGKDVSVFFKDKDNIKWQTQLPYNTEYKISAERHKLKFRFPKPEGAKNALLLVNCGTAQWGSNMIKEMLQLRGNKVDEWYQSVNTGGIEMFKLYQFMEREELYTLKVNLLEGSEYKSKTYIPAGGPLVDEDKIIRLPLENVTGKYVEFTLNPPAGYWKIDQIGIIYDYEIIEKDRIKEIEAAYAVDQDNKDFVNEIRNSDKAYYNMPEPGNTSNVYFDVPPEFDKTRNEIFLKTKGYYEVRVDREKKEQRAMIDDIMATPGKIIKYSMMLYNQKIKDITENKTIDNIKIKQ